MTHDETLILRIWAEMLEDAQQARIAAANRATRGGVVADLYAGHIAELEHAEHQCGLELRRAFRKAVPAEVRSWQKASPGIGEHLLARLVGHLGDPTVATPMRWEGTGANRVLVAGEPYYRTVSQLWSLCGHGDPARRRRSGMSAEELFACGNPTLKMLVHLLAEAVVKTNRGVYRGVYDDARTRYADRVHAVECVRCGPSGKPAQPGSPWSPGHQHAAAMRLTGKEVLRDLWIVWNAATADMPVAA